VAQPDGRLDQSLVEAMLEAVALGPQVFPDLVGLEEIARVEEPDTRQVARIVSVHAVAPLVKSPPAHLYCTDRAPPCYNHRVPFSVFRREAIIHVVLLTSVAVGADRAVPGAAALPGSRPDPPGRFPATVRARPGGAAARRWANCRPAEARQLAGKRPRTGEEV